MTLEIQKPSNNGNEGRISKWMHLWNGANTLLKCSPTISRHLGHKLMNEGMNEMSSFSKSLLCKKCGTLTLMSSTRICKRRRALRGRKNKVIIRCNNCNAVRVEDGSLILPKEKNENKNKRRQILSSSIDNDKQVKANKKKDKSVDDSQVKRILKAPRAKKKPNNQEVQKTKISSKPTGLAASFLFEEIDQ